MQTKVCGTCKNRKEITEFYKKPIKYYKDGYHNRCKSCELEYDRQRMKDRVIVKDGKKICSKCKEEKDATEFSIRLRAKDGLRQQCKICDRAYNKNYAKKHPTKRALNRISQKYGIDEQQYLELIKNQDNKCKICNNLDKLVVDHCHITGKVRGLLCSRCNAGLGMFADNIDIMKKAIEYIENNVCTTS